MSANLPSVIRIVGTMRDRICPNAIESQLTHR